MTLKLLIADDDEQIRSGLEQGVDWSALDIESVLTASNGKEALRIFAEHLPEIVITDVRMPGIDGLELLARIKAIEPRTRVIVLSGFTDFDYMKKAIQLDAIDYEVKPVRIRNLIMLVQRIKDEIQRERVTEQDFQRYLAFYREQFEKGFLEGRIDDRLIIQEVLRTCYGFTPDGPVVCAALRFEPRTLASPQAARETSRRADAALRSVFEAGLQGASGVYLSAESGTAALLLDVRSSSRTLQPAIEDVRKALETWKPRVERDAGASLSAGISGTTTLQDPAALLADAKAALEWRLYDGPGTIQVLRDDVRLTSGPVEGFDEDLYRSRLSHGEWRSAVDLLDRECDRLKGLRLYAGGSIRAFARTRIADILAYAPRLPLPVQRNVHEALAQLDGTTDLLDLEALSDACRDVFRPLLHEPLERLSPAMARVRDHIHANYAQDLSVEDLARLIGKSPNHFSHRFKLEFGTSFKSYLTRLRIAHAKQRILATDELIYEISEKVGFHDFTYFTSVFKKIEGHPPSHFRGHGGEAKRKGESDAR